MFRRDIQALRALAVLLVVGYHLRPDRLTGGYVGVDVFFVISGFLITAHLLRELGRSGTIRLSQFYARRARRLLPASSTVLLASAVAAFIWLPKAVWQQTFSEIIGSALYAVNWVLAANSTNYLNANNTASIVQHYWSLSVEEQFYLVWPGLIIVTMVIARRVTRVVHPKRILAGLFLTVFALSLGYSIWQTARSQPTAYFVTPTRVWEFAAGGLLALAPAERMRRWPASAAVLSWIGVAAILVAAVRLDGASAFPGWIALLPVFGTVLLIWIGEVEHPWSPSPLTHFGPVQLVGDISYGIYLWHWPLIVVYPAIRGTAPGLRGDAIIVIASVALAWLTKKLIEDPVRRGRFWSSSLPRTFSMAGAGAVATVLVGTLGLVAIRDVQAHANDPQASFASQEALQYAIQVAATGGPSKQGDSVGLRAPEWINDKCLDVSADNVARCSYGSPDAPHTVAVVGDSIAMSYVPAIRKALEPLGWRVQVLTWEQCPLADVHVYRNGQAGNFVRCDEHHEWSMEYVASMHPDLIIAASLARISSIVPSGDATVTLDAMWSQGEARTLAKLRQAAPQVVVIGQPPLANCGPRSTLEGKHCSDGVHPAEWYEREEREVAAAGGNYVNTVRWFCNVNGICPEQIGSTPVRFDDVHISGAFAQRLDLVLLESLVKLGLVSTKTT